MLKNAKLLGSVLAAVILITALAGLVVGIFTGVPDFRPLKSDRVRIPIHLANGDKSFKWVGPSTPDWVPIDRISDDLLMAVISSEDTAFFTHQGVDMHELREAIKKDIEEKRWARGASTLTQQVVKNVYLSAEKTLWRKFKEILWARELEKVLTKRQILCFYANMAEWGPGIYGIKAAADHYFSETPAELTPRQSAFLAMLLPSPRRYHAYFQRKQMSAWATGRVNHILHVMNRMGFIDEPTYSVAMKERLWGEKETSFVPPSENEEAPESEGLPPEDAPFEGVVPERPAVERAHPKPLQNVEEEKEPEATPPEPSPEPTQEPAKEPVPEATPE